MLLLLVAAACAAPAPRDPGDPFAVDGAEAALRPSSEEDRAALRAFAADLSRLYGYRPDGSLRDLKYLRDVYERPALRARLLAPETTALSPAILALGGGFRPEDGEALAAAPAGPAGATLRAPPVSGFLSALRAEGRLHPEALRDLLRASPEDLEALAGLASAPDGVARVRAEAATIRWRLRPSDAADLLAPERPVLTPDDETFLAPLLAGLGVEYRPRWRPELAFLAANRQEAEAFALLARDLSVPLSGPSAILALARLCRDETPPGGEARERAAALARRLTWPDAGDLRHLVRLAAEPRAPEVVADLERRYAYRFRAEDSADLLDLAMAALPTPALPPFILEDRTALVRPALLRSSRPAEAFVDPGDLRFLEAVSPLRPDLAAGSRAALERAIREALRGRPVRYREGAPYTETAEDLSGLNRADLLKAILVLEELDRPETTTRLLGLIARDRADPLTEHGGWVLLTPEGRLRFEAFEGAGAGAGDGRLDLPAAPAAVVEFHCHATDEDDTEFAGPSAGGPGTDLFRATLRRTDGLVLTALPGERFDADFYTSDRIVLDLGVRGGPAGR